MNGKMQKEKKAVALRYPKDSYAPFVVASEKGFLAGKLLEIAEKNNIPVVRNDGLADLLSVQEIGSYIPEQTWEAVAKIFAFIVQVEEESEKFYQN